MSNTIRTPREGVTRHSQRVAAAVDNEDWQRFRVGLKGTTTPTKIKALTRYYNEHTDEHVCGDQGIDDCDICIRVDNYIKALCRGGQLMPGQNLMTALNSAWQGLKIKRI